MGHKKVTLLPGGALLCNAQNGQNICSRFTIALKPFLSADSLSSGLLVQQSKEEKKKEEEEDYVQIFDKNKRIEVALGVIEHWRVSWC